MDFERDDPQDQTWKKENAKRDGRFDFAPFLGPDSLNDRVTHAADGKDVLDDEAFGDFSSVVPKVPFDGRHGRHLSPEDLEDMDEEEPRKEEPAPEEPEEDWVDEGDDGWTPPKDFQEKAPPRPKIIVADPTPKVYVDPRQNGYDQEDGSGGGGSLSGGQKGLAAVIIVLALVAIGMAGLFLFRGDLGGGEQAEATPTPSPTSPLSGLFDPNDRPTQPPAATPTPTAAPLATYTVTVTAGSGGTVSPGGAVLVQEGKDVSFTIQPDPYFQVAQILVDGSNVPVVDSYTFTNVRSDHTLYVVFQAIPETPPAASTPEPTAEPTPTPEITPEPTPEPTPEVTPEPPPAPGVETEPGPALPPEGGGDVPPADDTFEMLPPEAGE